MKTQINKGNGNVQQSDDKNTLQIQIGESVIQFVFKLAGSIVSIGMVAMAYHWLL